MIRTTSYALVGALLLLAFAPNASALIGPIKQDSSGVGVCSSNSLITDDHYCVVRVDESEVCVSETTNEAGYHGTCASSDGVCNTSDFGDSGFVIRTCYVDLSHPDGLVCFYTLSGTTNQDGYLLCIG